MIHDILPKTKYVHILHDVMLAIVNEHAQINSGRRVILSQSFLSIFSLIMNVFL